MDKQPKVSVIIPVYNAEKYLRECLDSVVNQTLKEIEVICVDDGSTDSSLAILREYANQDSRIRIRTQKNQGSGIARNAGINCAHGVYIAFMDADDYYPDNDVLAAMYLGAEENGVSICGGGIAVLRGEQYDISPNKCFSQSKMIFYRDYQEDYGYYRYLYAKKLLDENNIRFPNYLRYQDPPFMALAMVSAEKFYALDRVTYVYRWGHQNIKWTSRKANDMAKGILDNLKLSKKYQLKKLHTACVNRVNHDWERVFTEALNNGDQEILDTLKKINREIKVSWLPANLLNRGDNYLIVPLQKLLAGYREKMSVRYKIFYLLRKIRGGILCVKDHGLIYTVRHGIKKIKNKLRK